MAYRTLLTCGTCGDSGCLAWIAFIRVSTSVAKLMPVPSVGSERERSSSAPYEDPWNDGLDCRGDAVADFESVENVERAS